MFLCFQDKAATRCNKAGIIASSGKLSQMMKRKPQKAQESSCADLGCDNLITISDAVSTKGVLVWQ
jgi:hypothetical protein